MPQGKLKVKAKLPASVVAKNKAKKGPSKSNNSRANKPQKPKVSSVQKLKNETLKRIHKSTEDELRSKALDGKVNLGKKKRPAPSDNNDDASTSEAPSKKRKT